MMLRDRIGVDVGRKLRLEDAVAWAAEHHVRFIDVQLDTGANALGTIDDARAAAVRAGCERHGIHLGLHTSSAVNVAEYAPFVGEAVDRYLDAYVDAAGSSAPDGSSSMPGFISRRTATSACGRALSG